MTLKTRRIMLFSILGVFFSTAFMNCGQGFKTDEFGTNTFGSTLGSSDPTVSFKFDSAIPDVMNANNSSVAYTVMASSNSYILKCTVDAVALQDCQSPINLASATEGDHTVRIFAQNSNGLVLGEISRGVRLDRQAPTLSITSAPPSVTGLTTASVQFSSMDNLSQSSDITTECALDATAFAACTSPKSYSGLAAGAHTLKIRAIDRAGNTSDVTAMNFTVSLGLPSVSITQNPAAYINTTSATFTFNGSSSNSTITGYECSLDNGTTYETCTSPKTYTGLSNSGYDFAVRSKDAINQTSGALKVHFVVDTVAPTTPSVSSNLTSPSKQTSLNLSFSSNDAAGITGYLCSLDGGAYASCSSPKAYSGLTSATHTFKVKATDQAGNVSAEGSYSILIDVVAPDVSIASKPTNPSADVNPTFTFAATDASSGLALIECQVDTISPFAACSSPKAYSNLPKGNRVFSVRATDKAGNSSMQSYAWTIADAATPTPTPAPTATPTPAPTATPIAGVPNPASANAKVELRIVHSAGELYKRGCDLWSPNSQACRSASNDYCVTRGYVGGYGPVLVDNNTSTVSCVGTVAGDAKMFAYSGSCASNAPGSLACQSLAMQSCTGAGYVGSNGVVGSDSSGIKTVCIKSGAGSTSNVTASLSQLQSAASGTCDANTIAAGTGCMLSAHAYCKSKGYGTGFLANAYSNSSASVYCVPATSVTTELTYDTGYGQYARGAVLGQPMTVGGMTSAGDTTHPDVIVNNFNYPIVLTYVAPTTSYVAPNGGNYSLDTSVFLNHGTYFPNDPTIFDGEIISVYSSQPTVPTVNFGQYKKGLLLKPGDHLSYQGAAKWGSGGTGLYNVGTMQFQAVSEGYTPMLRRRFPSVDSSFKAGLVPAGCDASCNTQPTDSYVGFPKTASNFWYKAPAATTIGGLQIFTNSPIKSGRVRVVNDAGTDIVTPYSFAMPGVTATWTNALVLGAGAFNNAFGAGQNGSSFIQLNIAVPAGARVGIEWDLTWGGDFAGFLYFNQ